MRTYRVKEMTVMAYHQHGMFKVRKVFFKPGHRIHIQVVSRLVEQQVVRISEKRLCQHHAHLFLTTQITHQRVVLVFFYAQSAQQDSCISLGIPAFQFGKLFFPVRLALIPSSSVKSSLAYRASRCFMMSQRMVCPISTASSTVWASNLK